MAYFFEPPIPEGHRRLRWKCACGAQLWDDYIELFLGALDTLEKELKEECTDNTLARDKTVVAMGHDILTNIGRLTRLCTRPFSRIWHTIFSKPQANAATTGGLPMHQLAAQTVPAPFNPPPTEIIRLLICLNKGMTQTQLHRKEVHSYSTDRDLFAALHREYSDWRKPRTWFTLRGISRLALCRFSVDSSDFTEVHKHEHACASSSSQSCICLPPLSKVAQDEYRCTPAPTDPPKQMPPIAPNRLTHYFLHPELIKDKQKSVYSQIPKAVNHELRASAENEIMGWGIHFEEGWHWKTIYLIVVVFLVVSSLVFGIAWSATRSDIQGGFAISSVWINLAAILLGYLAVNSQ